MTSDRNRVVAVGAVMVMLVVACGSELPASSTGVVVSVSDGDSIVVDVDGRRERLRLIGIDAPEEGDCLADESTAWLAARVDGRVVVLERDVSDRDRFGRLLRYVFVEGEHVNENSVAAGMARAVRFEPDTARAGALEAAERQARQSRTGLWNPDWCP